MNELNLRGSIKHITHFKCVYIHTVLVTKTLSNKQQLLTKYFQDFYVQILISESFYFIDIVGALDEI